MLYIHCTFLFTFIRSIDCQQSALCLYTYIRANSRRPAYNSNPLPTERDLLNTTDCPLSPFPSLPSYTLQYMYTLLIYESTSVFSLSLCLHARTVYLHLLRSSAFPFPTPVAIPRFSSQPSLSGPLHDNDGNQPLRKDFRKFSRLFVGGRGGSGRHKHRSLFFFSPSFYPSTSSFQRYYTYILYVYINVDITELFNDYIQLRSFFFYSSTLVFNFFFFFFIYLFFDAKCWLISFVLFPLCCILYYIYDVCVCVCCQKLRVKQL